MSECICHTIIGRHHTCPAHSHKYGPSLPNKIEFKSSDGKCYYILEHEFSLFEEYRAKKQYEWFESQGLGWIYKFVGDSKGNLKLNKNE